MLKKFGVRVRQERERQGISQEELAHHAGVHRTYVGMIERAEKNVTLKSMEKIARALHMDVAELVGGETLPTATNRYVLSRYTPTTNATRALTFVHDGPTDESRDVCKVVTHRDGFAVIIPRHLAKKLGITEGISVDVSRLGTAKLVKDRHYRI